MTKSNKKKSIPTVWVGVISNDHGPHCAGVAKTEAGAKKLVYEYVAYFWEDVEEEYADKHDGNTDCPKDMDEAIKFYFRNHPEGEWYSIASHPIQN